MSRATAPQKSAAPEPDAGPRPERLGLAGILGQEAVVEILRGALRRGRPHHAYLFDGPEGVGKATCARALFAALNCLTPGLPPGDACGDCDACRKLLAGTHPDLIRFEMKELAGLAEATEGLVRRLAFRPHEGRAQLVIFDPADNFSAPTALTAANRLLKTLEEPIPDTHFVLVSCAAQGLLVTLRSRTQRLRFRPLGDALIQAELRRRRPDLDEAAAAQLAKLAQGSLGRALREVEDAEGVTRRQQAAQELRRAARERRVAGMVSVAAELGTDREEALAVLDLLWLDLHGELPGTLQRGRRAQLTLARALRSVREAQDAIRRYTNAQLVLERLLRQLSAPELGRAA